MKLLNQTQNQVIVENLEVAKNMWPRMKGLLGRASLESNQGLWLVPGNSIHTFFMKFAIDCIFVDKNLKVKALVSSVVPGKLVGPYWTAKSVFELPAGSIVNKKIQIGDQLHVGT